MLSKMRIATVPIAFVAFGFMTTGVTADSSVRGAAHQESRATPTSASQQQVLRRRKLAGGYVRSPGGGIWSYDGPIYNEQGQLIGTYRGPVQAYSTSCNILTPVGRLDTCQNFTW